MRTFPTTLIALTVLFAATACGDDGGDDGDDASLEATTTEEDDGGMAGDDHESFAFGEPADEADADRTVEVEMFDDFRYEPPSIDVAVGETVAFQVTNSGQIVHEFVLGDESVQEEHEEEMEEMEGDMAMEDDPNGVSVEAGDTETLTFRFTEPVELQYACHEPGHYDAGMHAPLTVS